MCHYEVCDKSVKGSGYIQHIYCIYLNSTDQQKPPEDCEHESTGAADSNDEGVVAVLQATVQVHAEEASDHHAEAAGKSSKLNEHCYLH